MCYSNLYLEIYFVIEYKDATACFYVDTVLSKSVEYKICVLLNFDI